MNLYLVRHGEAQSAEVDPERHLTERGTAAVHRLAQHLQPLHIHVDTIYHSGKARAAQTAQLLSEAVTATAGPTPRDGLHPNAPVEPIAKAVLDENRDVMLVGHQPFMSTMAGYLLQAPQNALAFHEATIACLKHSRSHGWRLMWSISPDIVK